MSVRTAIIIPSRFGSSRFPGKPLASIAGRSLVERVWRNALAVQGADTVVIATDDDRIERAAQQFGAQVVRTSPDCRNGTERVHEAMNLITPSPDIVINMQGDTPLTPPWFVEPLIDLMRDNPSVQLATPALRLTGAAQESARNREPGLHGGTYLTKSADGRALYFSRYPIPFIRADSVFPAGQEPPLFKHIGIYCYRRSALTTFVSLEPTPCEQAEQLEQLRALETGMPIHVVEVDARGRSIHSVDTPEDARAVERIIACEGEILS